MAEARHPPHRNPALSRQPETIMTHPLLGRTVTDKITGFTGIVTGYVTYLTGCNQALVVPKVGKDGTAKEPLWFDEQRLAVAATKPVSLDNSRAAGFDHPAPIR